MPPDDDFDDSDVISPPSGNVDSFYTLPPGRWAELVSGTDEDPVCAEEVRTVFHWIERRLALGQAAQVPSPQPQDGSIAWLSLPEGGNGAPVLSSALPGIGKDVVTAGDAEPVGKGEDGIAFSEAIASITTVGQLHEMIERIFGPSGWQALMACWYEAAGIFGIAGWNRPYSLEMHCKKHSFLPGSLSLGQG